MRTTLTAIVAATLMAGSAIAQMPSPAAKPAARTVTKPARAPVVRTAKSLGCSKQADAKGLHGKPRKGFMSGCKKA